MEQEALVAALCDPATYPHRPSHVEHVQTHISHVFLAGPYVYKLKKALRLPFVDQSSAALRAALCEAEVRLNRRLAAAVYLDRVAITLGPDGRPRLGGDGDVVDHLVWMRRLPHEAVLARRVVEGRVDDAMMVVLAHALAAFHAAAPSGPAVAAHAAPEALRATWDHTMTLAEPLASSLLSRGAFRLLQDFGPGFVRTHETLLRARQRGGHVREGHGDLHAEHVYFVDAPVPAPPPHGPLRAGLYVVDCIEFSEALRCNDVAAEIAFTAMDVERLGRPDLARVLVSAYVVATGDDLLPTLLPYYVAHRACVRGAVEGLTSREGDVDAGDREAAAARAREDFLLALRHAWATAPAMAIACCGRSGTGKTALAAALGRATGFAHLSSDRLRKERAGLDPERPAPDPAALYTPEARAANYAALVAEADRHLAAGRSVIVDATFLLRADRARLVLAAHARGCRHVFLECRAAADVVRARLEARDPGTSDARWSTYCAQEASAEPFEASEPRVVVDTGGSLDAAVETAFLALWAWHREHPPTAPVHR